MNLSMCRGREEKVVRMREKLKEKLQADLFNRIKLLCVERHQEFWGQSESELREKVCAWGEEVFSAYVALKEGQRFVFVFLSDYPGRHCDFWQVHVPLGASSLELVGEMQTTKCTYAGDGEFKMKAFATIYADE
ncbi:hypothetical protein [Shouchella lonarensis]|uniref:Uncharacterized protein n=1 Tax=Shouchella lonarensis TaxID=1464122 RepID=A0A1G6HLS6_9BACI|nr:hypothetical protein [Shouchella lonarensis]SDB95257.1 hypothetical protein SAMN05421737_10470 [Shouchella lonarensis]